MASHRNPTFDPQSRKDHAHLDTNKPPLGPDSNSSPGRSVARADNRQNAMLSQFAGPQNDRPRTPPPPAYYTSSMTESPESCVGGARKPKTLEAHAGPSTIDEKHQEPAYSASVVCKRDHDIRKSGPRDLKDITDKRKSTSASITIAHACAQCLMPNRTHTQSEKSSLYQQQMPGQDEYLKLQNKLDQKEREMKALQEQFHEERAWLTNKLQEAREISRMLQQEVDKQGQSIDNLRKHAMAQLASDNSSSFPDDAVERSFRQFFNNEDFEGWIDENKAAQIKDAKTTIQTLQQSNVMGESNLKVGLHLKSMQKFSVGVIQALVEGALVRDFCRRFLSNPFFQCPELFSDNIRKMANTEAFIEWRIHTYKVLGLKYDRKPEIFQAYALEFCKANSGILGPLTKEALDELSGFYKEFANLAQKLWMLKTCITVEGLEQHSLHKFSDSGMRAHDLIRNGPDASAGKLNGRPIWALVRPRIVSWPLRNKDGRGIVWSQAVVWV